MSRLLGIGNTSTKAYRKLKQTPSDDEIESSEEYTVFDKNDKSTIELQLVPDVTVNRKKHRRRIHTEEKKNSCQLYLLLLGIVVVALSGLIVGIVLVKALHVQPESRNNATYTISTQEVQGVTEPTYELIQTSEKTIQWKRVWEDTSGESCVRLLDVDGDGKDDIIFGAANAKDIHAVLRVKLGKYGDLEDFCHQIGKQYPCMGFMMAIRGYDGQVLWNLTVRSEVFLLNCEDFDINEDGKPDCIGTGRQGVAVAFNPYTGTQYWSVEDDRFLMANWNIYQAVKLPDWNKDGVSEVLFANGGDPKKQPTDHDRESGRLVVVCGKRGQVLGERYLEMPNSRETYMTPVLYQPPFGSSIILFGSGGETVSGDLMGISAVDLCHYIFGDQKASDHCSERETVKFWPSMKRDEKGLFTVIKGASKGVMVPPVIVDIDGDSIDDILVSDYGGRMVMKNGKDLSDMWSISFSGMESYSTPAPGYFDDDSILDFMVHWCAGAWPDYTSSNVSVISGKNGSILWTLESTSYQMTSDLIVRTSDYQRDIFLFKLKGLGSPYRRNEDGEFVNRTNENMREKRHGDEAQPPAPYFVEDSAGVPLEEQVVRLYRKYHITCDEDLSRHRGEIFVVDRSTMKNPLKILDIPLRKYWYDAPYVDPSVHMEANQEQPGKTHNMSESHKGGHMMSDSHKNISKSERRCLLMDSDDRSTGAIGDLNGDGVLEYIAIYAETGQVMDTMYSYYETKTNLHVSVVSLNLNTTEFKTMSVPSKSSFQPKQPLKNIRDVHILPYKDQKWTQYMGKHGNSKYEH